jgi:hypothetical protein
MPDRLRPACVARDRDEGPREQFVRTVPSAIPSTPSAVRELHLSNEPTAPVTAPDDSAKAQVWDQ